MTMLNSERKQRPRVHHHFNTIHLCEQFPFFVVNISNQVQENKAARTPPVRLFIDNLTANEQTWYVIYVIFRNQHRLLHPVIRFMCKCLIWFGFRVSLLSEHYYIKTASMFLTINTADQVNTKMETTRWLTEMLWWKGNQKTAKRKPRNEWHY